MKMHSPMSYEFAPFRLDLRQGRLLCADQEIKLRPRVFKLLAVLVEHHGRLISDDELMERVWEGKVVGENVVVVSVGELRRALGREGLIERVSGRGYRFTATVKPVSAALPAPTADPPPPFGALPLNSPFYIARKTDEACYRALARRDSIVLVKGARQAGKTSLLARGLQKAREAGAVTVLTDLQQPSKDAFASLETLLLTLGTRIAEQLDLPTPPHAGWSQLRSANGNFEHYLRHVVCEKIAAPLVWALDEVDRLFEFAYAGELFSLFRTWHNQRAYEPAGPWSRLTLVLAYATEAHLFITDLNQSPFNVGTKLALEDFSAAQLAELNARYGAPLKDEAELLRFAALVGGHPYLAHRGLYELAQNGLELAAFESSAAQDEGIFGDHLRRLLASLTANAALCEAVRGLLQDQPPMTRTDFYHLRTAGVLAGDSVENARFRCRLYADFLSKHL